MNLNFEIGKSLLVFTTDCREVIGEFKGIAIIAQVIPCIVLEETNHTGIKRTTNAVRIIPMNNITGISYHDTGIIQPSPEEAAKLLF
jgi:hypothetical protein